jgi:hypothetical protein
VRNGGGLLLHQPATASILGLSSRIYKLHSLQVWRVELKVKTLAAHTHSWQVALLYCV